MARIVSTFIQIRNLNYYSYQNLPAAMAKSLKIAVIGQSVFARDVYNLIKKNGHTIVGVFTIPDKNGREVRNSSGQGTNIRDHKDQHIMMILVIMILIT